MDNITFREVSLSQTEADKVVEKPQGIPETTYQVPNKEVNHIIPPLSVYQEAKGHPYSVEHLDMKDTWQIYKHSGKGELVYPKLDKKVGVVESYIRHQMQKNFMADTTESAQTVLRMMDKLVDYSSIHDPIERLDKLYSWIVAGHKTKAINKLRKALEQRSIDQVVNLDYVGIRTLSKFMPRK